MLKQGTKAPAKIRKLQTALNALGYLTVIDGEFGPATKTSVKAFQKDNSLEADGIVGSLTQATLDLKTQAVPATLPVPAVPVSKSETPWMDFMKRNLGQKEISGAKANPFIVDLFRYTSLKGLKIALSDETAWCAACVSAALEKNGYLSTHSASAASYDRYGEKCDPKFGAIVTFKRKGGSGRHVTFFDHFDKKGNLVCIGGNQSNMIKYSSFPRSGLTACRWPVKAAAEVPKLS